MKDRRKSVWDILMRVLKSGSTYWVSPPMNAMTCGRTERTREGIIEKHFVQTNFRVTSGTWIISCINDDMDKLRPRSL